MNTHGHERFALCIENRDYGASLEIKKVYRVLADTSGETHGLIRIVDDSGEDYLYPAAYFVEIDVPAAASRVFGTGR